MKKVIAILRDDSQIITTIDTAQKNNWWITYNVECILEPEAHPSSVKHAEIPKTGNLITGIGGHIYRIATVEPVEKCFVCQRTGKSRVGNKFYCKKHFNKLVVTHPIRRTSVKTHRNALCPCGSGKKFKQCCITKDAHTKPRHYFNSEYKQQQQTKKTA